MGRRGTPDDHQGRLAGPSGHFGETFPKTTAVPSQKGTFWCKKKNWAPQTDCATTPLPRQHALCPYWLLRVAGGHPAALLRLRALGSVAPPLKSPDFIAAEHNPPARLHENGRGPMEAPNGPPWLGLQPLRPCSGPWPAPRSRPTTKRKSSLDPPLRRLHDGSAHNTPNSSDVCVQLIRQASIPKLSSASAHFSLHLQHDSVAMVERLHQSSLRASAWMHDGACMCIGQKDVEGEGQP